MLSYTLARKIQTFVKNGKESESLEASRGINEGQEESQLLIYDSINDKKSCVKIRQKRGHDWVQMHSKNNSKKMDGILWIHPPI